MGLDKHDQARWACLPVYSAGAKQSVRSCFSRAASTAASPAPGMHHSALALAIESVVVRCRSRWSGCRMGLVWEVVSRWWS
jgi:hypothetical protein